MELCHFVSLEILNLYHNCIRVIPEAIVNLQMLTYLNLSRNQLSALPACLCGLPLKVLIASNNKLGSLPEEIGQLKQLMELDVSCNEITALPQQIGQLKSLRELNVRRNYLKVLPQELVDLPLVKFDFSCNKVLVIPICFREMKQLQVLLLENNPLQSPPAQVRGSPSKRSDLVCIVNMLNENAKMKMCGSSCCGAAETNPTRSHEVAGSIPGLPECVKDPALP
uniref:Leucine rich repeats and calponin homology domain containing 1 n=1 Tax=Sus scrofa TaxID=9823 RepID=A0A8D1EFH3_PIG